ncbi:hypothetical protein HETIRDRAFT_454165 [Heterobasidion irregulare TC 32-1]|uniref:Uncharacterized protein n=1 Tax=Heterobasidion irregulare (strain TC 32-1) TaxID=747525 RepID=W4JZ20_HETIT|nr:uncharacterized protein HETIRDRAFT_454165 [Heterobasidion irregulare TC 32-1]ETW78131.1 hypothetical protein HETIRDRAFT_454165 [Heterobasidion irregulare TC 32-1]
MAKGGQVRTRLRLTPSQSTSSLTERDSVPPAEKVHLGCVASQATPGDASHSTVLPKGPLDDDWMQAPMASWRASPRCRCKGTPLGAQGTAQPLDFDIYVISDGGGRLGSQLGPDRDAYLSNSRLRAHDSLPLDWGHQKSDLKLHPTASHLCMEPPLTAHPPPPDFNDPTIPITSEGDSEDASLLVAHRAAERQGSIRTVPRRRAVRGLWVERASRRVEKPSARRGSLLPDGTRPLAGDCDRTDADSHGCTSISLAPPPSASSRNSDRNAAGLATAATVALRCIHVFTPPSRGLTSARVHDDPVDALRK